MTLGHNKVEATELGVGALTRIAEARDIAIRQSNRFLLAGMLSSLFYAIKVAGLRIDIVVADTKVFETPYGLFVFGVIGSSCFILAQLRFLDGRALDLRLKRASPLGEACFASHKFFPSAHDWLLPSEEMFANESSPLLVKLIFTLLGFLALVVYSVPLLASAHFLINWPDMAGENYTDFQWWLVLILFSASLITYLFGQWIYQKKER